MTLEQLVEAGWPVVPLRPGEKAPRAQSWTERTFSTEDFHAGDNVGVKTGVESGVGVLVDVDCDCAEAVAAAGSFLPPTRVHGRPGRPSSHHWFVCVPGSTPGTRAPFSDVDGSMLVELRGRDHQTMVPPSIHTSGEPLRWENDLTPKAIAWDDLHASVRAMAVAVILARHYPDEGSRHEAYSHLGGVLARVGLPLVFATQVVRVATSLAGDKETTDRIRAVSDTYEAFAADRPTTGAPHFERVWPDGQALLGRIYQWFGYAGNDVIDRMNEQHFVVPGTTAMLVGTEEPGAGGVSFQTFGAFRERYLNVFVNVPGRGDTPRRVSAGVVWLESPGRRTYRKVVFAPPGAPPPAADEYNLWRGFAVDPMQDLDLAFRHTERFRQHLSDVVCGGRTDYYHWLMDFFADMIQTPGRPSGKSLALRGRSGTGKSLTIEAVGALLGGHFLSISSREQLVGRFNGHLSGKVLVFADEAMWGGDRQHAGVYKRMVTQTTLAIERKGVDVINERNCMRVTIASNEDWVVPATIGERRATVLQMDKVMPQTYFHALWQELQQPRFHSALLTVLQQWAVNEVRLRTGVVTAALIDQIDRSGDPIQQWWSQCLHEGSCSTNLDQPWPEWVSHAELYDKFTEDMGTRGAGFSYRGTRKAFIARLSEFLGGAPTEQRNVTVVMQHMSTTGPRMCIQMPPLGMARAHFDRIVGYDHAWGRAMDVGTMESPQNLEF